MPRGHLLSCPIEILKAPRAHILATTCEEIIMKKLTTLLSSTIIALVLLTAPSSVMAKPTQIALVVQIVKNCKAWAATSGHEWEGKTGACISYNVKKILKPIPHHEG